MKIKICTELFKRNMNQLIPPLFRMKKTFLNFFAYSMLLLFGGINLQAQDAIKKNLKGLNEQRPDTSVVVFIEVKKMQPVAKGLVFNLTIQNNTGNELSIHNPTEYIQLSLTDEKGNDVSVPGPPPKALLDGPQGMVIENKSFLVLNATLNNKALDKKSLSEEALTLSAKGKLEFIIQIQNIKKKTGGTELTKITKGKYDLAVFLSFIEHKENGISKTLMLDPITLELK